MGDAAGSRFDEIFRRCGPAEVRAALVRALRSGSRAAADSFAFNVPRSDGHTFGNDLWRFVWHDVGVELGALPGARLLRPRNSFLVQLGPAVLYPFRYGQSVADDVRSCRLDDSEFRRGLLVDPATPDHLFWPEVVLVAYAANPQVGLCRAYVGGARIVEDDLLDWRWLEELDLGAAGPGTGWLPVGGGGQPPFAPPPEPQLELTPLDGEAAEAGDTGGA